MNLKSTFFSSMLMIIFFGVSVVSKAQEMPETMKQIQALLSEKASRTPTQQKISSRLLQAVRENRGEQMAKDVSLEKAEVNASASGDLKVDIDAVITEQFLSKFEALGGKVIKASYEYHSLRAMINLKDVEKIAALPEVRFIKPAVLSRLVDAGMLQRVAEEKKSFAVRSEKIKTQLINYLKMHGEIQKTGSPYIGSVTSEGDRTHRADDVRNTYGFSGKGVRIGVISDSYNSLGTASADVASGDLPGVGNPDGKVTPVTVVEDITGGSDEGRAMLQVVHDLAPDAKLYFATGNVSEADFAANIINLRAAPNNCDIILDDLSYFDEPPFQDGLIAQAVDQVTAAGALYFSAAGNSGNLLNGTSGVFEGDFNDAGSLAFTSGTKAGTVHNFGTVAVPSSGDTITNAGEQNGTSFYFFLNWSDPIGGSANDYDLFLVNSKGKVLASSTDVQSGTQDPIEGLALAATKYVATERLVVFKSSTASVRAFHITTERGLLWKATNGQTEGHACAIAAFCMAATPANGAFATGQPVGPYPNPFVSTNHAETFSSDGPRKIFYNPDSTAITPGNFLFGTNGGTSLKKPDLTAADGTVNTMEAAGLSPFYGTSCATPHAAAIAGLLLSAEPTLTPAQIRTILTTTALDIEGAGYDNTSGYGIVQAFQAMQAVNPTPVSTIVFDSASVHEGTVSNSNGSLDPGESGLLTTTISDPALVTATNVAGTITSSTAGVTVTQGSAAFGTVNLSGGSAVNTSTPFAFNIDTSVACGSTINFSLTVTYGGGGLSPRVFPFSIVVGSQPYKNINSKLGSPSASPNYASTTGTQIGRIARSVTGGSACGTLDANPGLAATTGSRAYDAYKFTNTSTASQCVSVYMTGVAVSADSIYVLAYNNQGFNPLNIDSNFLADAGRFTDHQSFSFNVASGVSFTLVVFAVNPATEVGTGYNLNVSLTNCNTFVMPLSWLSVTGTPQANNQVLLNWKIANENNVSSYQVESSIDGTHFAPLTTVAATAFVASSKSYQAVDEFPVAGNNYYRIKEVDKNGNFTYSKTVLVVMSKGNLISISPNPATSYVNIKSKIVMRQIQLFNEEGKLLKTINPASNNYTLPMSSLASGNYFIKLTTDDATINEKIVKQ